MSITTERTNPYGGNLTHRITFIDSDNVTIDVTRLVVEFHIRESIFRKTMSADFVFRDAIGLIDSGRAPMTGQEFMQIEFESNNSTLLGGSEGNMLFKVTKVSNKIELTPGSSIYTLHCASLEHEENMTREASVSYTDKLGHEAVRHIFDNFIQLDNGKELKEEETSNVVPYTSTGQTPFEAIDAIGKECYRADQPEAASHFLFYETSQGFNFRTISSLLEQDPRPNTEYYFSDPAVVGSYAPERTIIGHTYLDNVNTTDLLERGLYENSTSVIDPLTKTFSEGSFNYAKDFNKLPHIPGGGHPTLNLSRSKVLGNEIQSSSHKRYFVGDLAARSGKSDTFDDRITPDNDPYTFHARERFTKASLNVAQLASLRQHGINITVPVNLNTNAGDIIQIFIPGNKDREGVEDSAFINHYGSNPTFLVTAVTTMMNKDGDYLTTMQCVKESFAVDLRGEEIQSIAGTLEEIISDPVNFIFQKYTKLPFGSDGIISNIVKSFIS